jgi:RNase P/RNase MRP subunit p30
MDIVDPVDDVVKTLERSGLDTAAVTMVKQLGSDDMEKLIKMKRGALNRVKTYITLVPEENTENKMVKSIVETPVGKLRGCMKDTRLC